MEFTSHRVVNDAKWWWALTIGDVTNDGLQDVVYINNNANGGYLGYREGSRDTGGVEDRNRSRGATPPVGPSRPATWRRVTWTVTAIRTSSP